MYTGYVRVVFLADCSKIGCSFLVVSVHEQDVGILSCGNAGEVCGDGRFSAASFDATHSENHEITTSAQRYLHVIYNVTIT